MVTLPVCGRTRLPDITQVTRTRMLNFESEKILLMSRLRQDHDSRQRPKSFVVPVSASLHLLAVEVSN